MSSNLLRVASVTVTFNPDPARLGRQIAALRGQVDDIIIVDNASDPALRERLPADIVRGGLIALADNCGVAAGFNIGIREARRRGAAFVLLLDHDSIPEPGMTRALVEAHRLARSGAAPPVAAVGPRIVDERDRNEFPFIRFGWLRNAHLRCGEGSQALVACDFLISSGSLVGLEAFAQIGEFDEGLFIDSVDLEWCCRARGAGFALYGACGARLDHALGDRRRAVVPGVRLVVHSPERLYYMTRNRLLLYRRGYVPARWKLKDALRAAAKVVAATLLLSPRREYGRMALRAVRDGLAGRGGRAAR